MGQFVVPRHRPEFAAETTVLKSERTMPTVLFVDDEQPLLTAIARVLRGEAFNVVTTTSPGHALRMIATEKIDVVVSDEQMPEMSGAALLEQVHKRHPEIVKIMLTGGATLAVSTRIIGKGHLYRFLSKPIDNVELRRILRQALHLRESLSLRPQAR
jgi:DNA-binding NtrC family response regulator